MPPTNQNQYSGAKGKERGRYGGGATTDKRGAAPHARDGQSGAQPAADQQGGQQQRGTQRTERPSVAVGATRTSPAAKQHRPDGVVEQYFDHYMHGGSQQCAMPDSLGSGPVPQATFGAMAQALEGSAEAYSAGQSPRPLESDYGSVGSHRVSNLHAATALATLGSTPQAQAAAAHERLFRLAAGLIA